MRKSRRSRRCCAGRSRSTSVSERPSCVAPILFVCRGFSPVRIVTSRSCKRASAVTRAELTGATTMFIHRNRGRNAQAVSLGLLAAALISTVVSAADRPDAFVLVAYSNRAGGTQIASGEYLSATQASARGRGGRSGRTGHQPLRGVRDERATRPGAAGLRQRRAGRLPRTGPAALVESAQPRAGGQFTGASPTPTARCCAGCMPMRRAPGRTSPARRRWRHRRPSSSAT